MKKLILLGLIVFINQICFPQGNIDSLIKSMIKIETLDEKNYILKLGGAEFGKVYIRNKMSAPMFEFSENLIFMDENFIVHKKTNRIDFKEKSNFNLQITYYPNGNIETKTFFFHNEKDTFEFENDSVHQKYGHIPDTNRDYRGYKIKKTYKNAAYGAIVRINIESKKPEFVSVYYEYESLIENIKINYNINGKIDSINIQDSEKPHYKYVLRNQIDIEKQINDLKYENFPKTLFDYVKYYGELIE